MTAEEHAARCPLRLIGPRFVSESYSSGVCHWTCGAGHGVAEYVNWTDERPVPPFSPQAGSRHVRYYQTTCAACGLVWMAGKPWAKLCGPCRKRATRARNKDLAKQPATRVPRECHGCGVTFPGTMASAHCPACMQWERCWRPTCRRRHPPGTCPQQRTPEEIQEARDRFSAKLVRHEDRALRPFVQARG
jgi:hypothetical protein